MTAGGVLPDVAALVSLECRSQAASADAYGTESAPSVAGWHDECSPGYRWLTYLLWEKWTGTGKEVEPVPGLARWTVAPFIEKILEEVAALPSLLVFAQPTEGIFV